MGQSELYTGSADIYSRIMRKLTVWLLLIVAGWAAGWYSHDHWQLEPELSRSKVKPVPLQAPVEAQGDEAAYVPSSPLDELSLLLAMDAYPAAIERYEALLDEMDEASVKRARQIIVSIAGTRVAQHQYPQATQLLQLYLVAELRDVEARMLLADIYHRQKDFRASVDQLFEAVGYAYRPDVLEQLTKRLRTVVTDHVNALAQSGDHSGLLELYQHLTQVEPSYAPHFIGLASAQLALNDTNNARRSLMLVVHDPDVGSRAQALLAQLQQAGPEEQHEAAVAVVETTGVPLIRRGDHFLVDARINNAKPVRLLIDTGASMTILTPAALDRSGIRYSKTGVQHVFNTANGQVTASVYRLDSLSVDDWQVSNLEIGVLDLAGSPSIDGLLGMNFLKHFQFFIDQNQALMRLSVNSQ